MEENKNGIFRQKSLDRLSSPENLNEYIKVANPGMWMGLIAIIVFLIGGIVWASFGKLEIKDDNGQVIEEISPIDLMFSDN